MTDNPAHMWKYWRDKYGYETALKEYYPELLKNDFRLPYYLDVVKTYKNSIDLRMEELEEEENG
tara:strand:- start:827 stop:1018 length:192 start_codon:yes stop_codon:yes gene_type:complete